MFNNSVLEIIIINLAFTIIAILYVWSRIQLKLSAQDKIDLEIKKREAFKNLLALHSDLILGKHNNEKNSFPWLEKFSEMAIQMLLWGSDKVVFEYGEYTLLKDHNEDEIKDYEIHFANAVLAFRKEIGYKNRFNKIKPIHIVIIFKVGYKNKTI